jgi:4-hydroxy-3-methylbut-2-en-1-yl diphosphate reductase
MKITLAEHYGMCFGVRDALKKAEEIARKEPTTLLGELVHNPVVQERLQQLGVVKGNLADVTTALTKEVIITAHGAADRDRAAWLAAGFSVTDTTCPLVKKAHHALAQLVSAGYFPIILGQANHVEVRGLAGDFPQAVVVETEADVSLIPPVQKLGIVSQTTQPIEQVRRFVQLIERAYPASEVVFRDTVCQPTKDRQAALEQLCREHEVIIVIGGRTSNNTRQLVLTAERFGAKAYQIQGPEEIDDSWFTQVSSVGITAGTSTLEETVVAVQQELVRRYGSV